jgi:4-diphosphocytidyl-2-C-methyl-D-erythritol kinase
MLTELRNLPAPAKLNLFLHVTGRRPDGYHLLETVFQLIDLADRIDLRLREDGEVRRLDPPGDIPEDVDLTVRAARALQAATGCRLGVDIALRKTIPLGGGLGGGSSDAATVLLGLDRLWGLGLGRDRLRELAVTLGADVPVFVFGHNAYATGIGEALQPVTLPPRWFVLVMPAVAVATQGVFRDPKLTRNTKPLTILGFSKQALQLPGHNDLQDVVVSREPRVAAALDALSRAVRQVAAEDAGSRVRMTGSGACVFAALDSLEAARETAQRVLLQNVGSVRVVAGLSRHPLGSRQVG